MATKFTDSKIDDLISELTKIIETYEDLYNILGDYQGLSLKITELKLDLYTLIVAKSNLSLENTLNDSFNDIIMHSLTYDPKIEQAVGRIYRGDKPTILHIDSPDSNMEKIEQTVKLFYQGTQPDIEDLD